VEIEQGGVEHIDDDEKIISRSSKEMDVISQGKVGMQCEQDYNETLGKEIYARRVCSRNYLIIQYYSSGASFDFCPFYFLEKTNKDN